MQREDLQPRVALQHRADGLERAGRVAVDGQDGAVVLEVEVVGQQQVDRAGAVADHGAVERVVADVGLERRCGGLVGCGSRTMSPGGVPWTRRQRFHIGSKRRSVDRDASRTFAERQAEGHQRHDGR